MTCTGCSIKSNDLKAVPGGGAPGSVFCLPCRKKIAAKHGRTTMRRKTQEEIINFTTAGGNALLRQLGTQYYSALGKKSGQKRSEARQLACGQSAR